MGPGLFLVCSRFSVLKKKRETIRRVQFIGDKCCLESSQFSNIDCDGLCRCENNAVLSNDFACMEPEYFFNKRFENVRSCNMGKLVNGQHGGDVRTPGVFKHRYSVLCEFMRVDDIRLKFEQGLYGCAARVYKEALAVVYGVID